MASVGSITVDAMRGKVMPRGAALEDLSRRGVDGVAARQIGARAGRSMIETEQAIAGGTSGATTQSTVASYRALQGTIQTLTDARGIATSVIVWSVQTRVGPIADADGVTVANADTMIYATWEVEGTA